MNIYICKEQYCRIASTLPGLEKTQVLLKKPAEAGYNMQVFSQVFQANRLFHGKCPYLGVNISVNHCKVCNAL
jgi:hypothetical protein